MILIVEDEQSVASSLADYLRAEGFAVKVAASVASATEAMTPDVELVVLDWMLPDGHGIDLLKRWRHAEIETPIIMLTARDELIDKVLGLELGADDYVTKPFEPRELLARIKARLRSVAPAACPPSKVRTVAGVTIESDTREVRHRGQPVNLTKMEFALLQVLCDSPNKVFTRDEILNRVWSYDNYPSTRTVDTHVLQLRQKIRDDLIETVRGVGYRIRAPKGD